MSLLQRLFSRSRLREARQALGAAPSAENYLALAREHARLGEMSDVQRVCDEALHACPGHPELQRMAERARALLLEDRTRELMRQLRDAPRPGLYRELCELYLDSGRVDRVEEVASRWFEDTGDGSAQLLRAQARLQRFRADKRREDARVALELLEQAERLLPRDERPLRERLELCCSIGAWRDARKAASRLLEYLPGDSVLEARFRTLNGLAENAPTLDAALRECERSGRLTVEEHRAADVTHSRASIRPLLQEIAASVGVQSALFERGSTALVQGPRGATAERTARAVREIVQKSRATTRRLGLGSPSEIEIEGMFGSVLITPNESGSAAVWCNQPRVPERLRASLRELVGAQDDSDSEEAS